MKQKPRSGSDSRCCSRREIPLTWLNLVDDSHASIIAFDRWFESLAPFVRLHEVGEIEELMEAAAGGELWESGDETTPIKPMATTENRLSSTADATLIKARAKVLAREDRELKAALIRVRRDAGLSQKEVADRLDVTQQSIQKLERYDSDPKASTLRRYANAVGAIVEHRAQADSGQSVHLAARNRWINASTNQTRSIEVMDANRVRATRSGWKTTTHRSDFDLAN